MSVGNVRSAFFDCRNLATSWNLAEAYAGSSGHIATLPEIVELRLVEDRSAWRDWYSSASVEYVGMGEDGRVKLVVAHGVGPVIPNYEGAGTVCMNEVRITGQQFLGLVAGEYGEVVLVDTNDTLLWQNDGLACKIDAVSVYVLDLQDYLGANGSDVFHIYLNAPEALRNPLVWMRLGLGTGRYMLEIEKIALAAANEWIPSQDLDDSMHPHVTCVKMPQVSPYVRTDFLANGRLVHKLRSMEDGYALAHPLYIDRPRRVRFDAIDKTLPIKRQRQPRHMVIGETGAHDWWDAGRFIAVPQGARPESGVVDGSELR